MGHVRELGPVRGWGRRKTRSSVLDHLLWLQVRMVVETGRPAERMRQQFPIPRTPAAGRKQWKDGGRGVCCSQTTQLWKAREHPEKIRLFSRYDSYCQQWFGWEGKKAIVNLIWGLLASREAGTWECRSGALKPAVSAGRVYPG